MKTGFQELSAREYHKDRQFDKPSLSATVAWAMCDSNVDMGTPKHGWMIHPRLGNMAKESSPEMLFGTICHSLFLGKGDEIRIAPFADYKTKAAQEWRDNCEGEGAIPVKKDQYQNAEKCVSSWKYQLKGFELDYILKEKIEQSITWNEDIYDYSKCEAFKKSHGDLVGSIYCRARLDMLVESRNEIWDLKTIKSAHPRKVIQKVCNEGLALKSEFYKRGIEKLKPESVGRMKHGFIFASTSYPFLITPVSQLDGQFQLVGKKQVQRTIDLWSKCLTENSWPGYVSEPLRLECPNWAFKDEILEDEE